MLPGGFNQFVSIGTAHAKFKIFHLSFDPTHADFVFNLSNPKSLAAGFFLGTLTTLAIFGTDQDIVQRMLTCETASESKKAVI